MLDIDQLLYLTGRLSKSYLISTSYGKETFKKTSDWQVSLNSFASQLNKILISFNTTLFEAATLSLQKYAKRKGLQSSPVPKNEKEVQSIAESLFGHSSLEIHLYDLFSEVTELHEAAQGEHDKFLDELGDVAYLPPHSKKLSIFMLIPFLYKLHSSITSLSRKHRFSTQLVKIG